MEPSVSRRTLLHRASAAVGAGALAGLAGCSSLRGGIDGSPKVPSWATYSPNPDRVFADRSSGDAAAEASRRYPIRARRLSDLAAYYDDRGEGFPDAALYQAGTPAHPVVDLPPSKAYLEVRAGGTGRYIAGHDAVGEVARRLGTGLTAAVDGVRDPETAADEGSRSRPASRTPPPRPTTHGGCWCSRPPTTRRHTRWTATRRRSPTGGRWRRRPTAGR
ncbi:hypothetical protein ACFQRB_18605 [Halobaculum litoreum]|uniref:Uncharacterized protein n=1 Tax=Halobaculum litoreum TaxID=3031998 RepID=A0ABD5XS31_9EURY